MKKKYYQAHKERILVLNFLTSILFIDVHIFCLLTIAKGEKVKTDHQRAACFYPGEASTSPYIGNVMYYFWHFNWNWKQNLHNLGIIFGEAVGVSN